MQIARKAVEKKSEAPVATQPEPSVRGLWAAFKMDAAPRWLLTMLDRFEHQFGPGVYRFDLLCARSAFFTASWGKLMLDGVMVPCNFSTIPPGPNRPRPMVRQTEHPKPMTASLAAEALAKFPKPAEEA